MADTVAGSFDEMGKNIADNADKAKEIGAIYQFNVTGDDGGSWTVNLTGDGDWVSEGASDDAQCTIELTAETWLGILSEEVNPMQAFMMGELKVEGDMGLATKLQMLFDMGGEG